MSSNIPQQYKDAAQQLPVDMLKEDFSVNGLTDKEVKAIHAKALFQENSLLLGMESGSVAGVNKRGAAAQDEKRKFEKQKEKKQKDTADTIMVLLADFNRFEDGLASKYGNDFALQWAVDLLDEDAAQHIASLPLEQQRLALWKEMETAFTEGSLDKSNLTPEQLRFYEDGAVKYQNADYESEQVLKNEKNADEISQLGSEVGKDKTLENAPDIKSDFEVASINFDQSTDSELDLTSLDTSFDLDGMDLA